ncbi:MAG: thioredoxin family protein [Candidatus Omnitrophota bacterium]
MLIQVLGAGCAKCHKLEENARKAATELNIDFNLEKITDIQKIMGFGVMSTPALVVDGQVKFAGKSPSIDELKKILAQ